MLEVLRRFIRIIKIALRSGYPYSKLQILITWIRLMAASVFYHKFTNRSNKQHHAKILGHRMEFDHFGSFIDMFEEIFIEQIYYFETAKTSPRIIDCGSNIGISVLYFKIIYPGCTIIAFEPDPDAFSTLQKNIAHNNLDGMEVHNLALAEAEGEMILFKNDVLINSSMKVSSDKSIQLMVKTNKLSVYIDREIDLLKVDIEGAEGIVVNELMHAQKIGSLKNIIIEYHSYIVSETLTAFLKMLSANFDVNILGDYKQKKDVIIKAVSRS
jgi:FkbM family methyltransferase